MTQLNTSRYVALALVSLITLTAAEYHGQIKSAGFPLPGVTVTATHADKTQTAATDAQGIFSFPDLPDGPWSLQVEKPGFAPIKQDITAGTTLPGPSFDLKMLPLDQMQTVTPSPSPELTTAPTPISTAPVSAAKGKTNAAPAPPQTAFQTTDLNATNTPTPAPEPPPGITAFFKTF